MLATMDANKFQEYFDNCPLVHIAGRNFHVDNIYTAEAGPNLIVLAARVVIDIHENEKPGDILVFLPGEGEIERVCRLVRLATKDLDVFPLHSTLSASKQNLALKSSGPSRKCIVSTNVAETSLTINGIVYVVDSGLARQLIFKPRLRLNMLQLRPISQASAKQRAGRAGRTRDGACYRLYTKRTMIAWFLPLSLPSAPCRSTRQF